jgi:hypothetical protein
MLHIRDLKVKGSMHQGTFEVVRKGMGLQWSPATNFPSPMLGGMFTQADVGKDSASLGQRFLHS